MLNLWKILLACTFIMTPLFCFTTTDQERKDLMLADLNFIKNTFQVGYAPIEWKQKYAGWDLETEIQSAKMKIDALKNPNAKEFQKIIKDFFRSTKDHHVGVMFYSTESATLPFRIKGANGRYFFSYIDRSRLSPHVFPFNEGDELVYFDGRPTHDVINELKSKEIGSTNESTDHALAELYLTTRIGALGHEVPKGPVMVTVKAAQTNNYSSFQLIWDYYPEKISSAFSANPLTVEKPRPILENHFFKKTLLAPFYELASKARCENDATDFMGSKKTFTPTLGRIWWETDESSSFHAYLFENDKHHLIGYIRIPSYMGGEERVQEFAHLINFFEERSDALIIDQVNNPGGYVFHLYALASMLTDQPLHTPKHRMKITPEDVFFAVNCISIFEEIKSDDDARNVLGENFEGIPVTYQMAQFILNFCRFIVDEWEAGRTCTMPFYLYGIDRINPDPSTRYSKPILLLVNHLDFSGGDFFPAILQDNKRVTILGTRTAGAGGYVGSTTFPNLFGISYFHYTASIAERADNNPIENLGVTPDIIYDVTQDDLQFGYRGYAENIHQAMNHLLQKNNN